jgi:hypothetical protein
MLYHRRPYLLASVPSLWQINYLHGRYDVYVLLPRGDRRSWLGPREERSDGDWNPIGNFDASQYDYYRTCVLSYCSRDSIGEIEVQDNRDWEVCVQPHWHF